MLNREELIHTVRRNCTISDATYAGQFSICGLALRLRDLYKWEQRLAPWEEHDSRDVLTWIGEQEDLWEKIGQKDYAPIRINGQTYDPFDTQSINRNLNEDGLFYGAGYAYRLKPTFYLTEIEKESGLQGHSVLLLGRELARDLLTLPALSQDGCIIVRKEAARLFFWDQMSYIKPSGRPAFKWGLKQCSVKSARPDDLRAAFGMLFGLQQATYIYHELGELEDTVFDSNLWREIIAAFPYSPTELLARAVKDLLADTGPSGPLANIVKEQNSAALAFYVAFSDGLVKELFPHIKPAFKDFTESQQWHYIDQAISEGYAVAQQHADLMSQLYLEGKRRGDLAWAADEIERQLL
jgi:hypothetical protein